jgi:Tol biopolymer transport system component
MVKKNNLLLASLSILVLLSLFCKKEKRMGRPWWWVPPIIADYPCWTPDGSKIAYCDHREVWIHPRQVWIVDTMGNTWNMFEDPSFEADLPSFSPDGEWLVFVSGYQIYKTRVKEDWRVDTSSITKLTNFGRNFFPKWSPNGDLIAYDSDVEDDSISLYGICLMRPDGTEKKRIEGARGRQPDWSPSGERIVYNDAGGQITIISIDGSQRKPLHIGGEPAWAPFDTLIAFSKDSLIGGRGKPFIYLIDTSGTRLSRLTSGMEPAWSPDGKKIAFLDLYSEGDWSSEYWTIYMIDLESKKRKQLIFK